MTSYVALLRGINVGGSHKVPMKDLRELVTELGAEDVATYVQSGNVVFRSTEKAAALVTELEQALEKQFGFAIPVIIRTAAELKKVVDANPWSKDDLEPTKLVVVFYQEKPKKDAFSAVDAAAFEPELFVHAGRELYLNLPDGQGRSKLVAAIGKPKLAPPGTARNWRSVTTLADMAAQL